MCSWTFLLVLWGSGCWCWTVVLSTTSMHHGGGGHRHHKSRAGDSGFSPHPLPISFFFPHLNMTHESQENDDADDRSSPLSKQLLATHRKQSMYMRQLYDALNRYYAFKGRGEESAGGRESPLIWGMLATEVISEEEDGRTIVFWFHVERTLKENPLQAELVIDSFVGLGYHITEVTRDVQRSLPSALESGRLRLDFSLPRGYWDFRMVLPIRRKPLLVLYYGIDHDRLRWTARLPPPPPSTLHRLRRRRSPEADSPPPLPSSSRWCRLHRWAIDVREFGWDSWMVSPTSFQPNYCAGQCPYLYMKDKKKPVFTHTMLRALYHASQPVERSIHVPRPCCIPTELHGENMIYVQENTIVIRRMENVVADKCGCV